MAADIKGVPFKLTAADLGGFGGFDLGEAIKSGLENANLYQEAKYKPQNLAEALRAAQLANKINEAKAQYAMEQELANLKYTQAGTGHLGAQTKNLEAERGLIPLRQRLLAAQEMATRQKAEEALRKEQMFADIRAGRFPGLQNQPTQPYSGQQQINQEQQPQDYISMLRGQEFTQGGAGLQRFPEQQQVQQPPQQIGPSQNEILRGLMYQAYGLKPPTEVPEEKMRREIMTSNIEEQNKTNIKRAQQISESAKDLSLAGIDINGIHDILTGEDSLGTGITKTLIGKLGWGSEKLGEFNERALRLQAQMTKALSSRGGVGAANIVASGKPNTWKSTSENLGITKAYAEHIKNEFDLLNKEYKNITGKNLPYTLPEYVQNIGKKIDKNIFKPKTTFNSEQEYHAYMNSLTPQQRQMVIKTIREASK